MSLAITRRDLSAEGLRGHARRCQDVQQACRLLALAFVLEGTSRTEAARAGGMDRQTLRDWVIRYNEAGVDGLHDLPRSGRPPRLNAVHLAELARLVEEGPDIAVHGVVRWRCVDLQAEIKARFDVDLSERQVGRILGQLKFTRLSVRPRHPQTDEAAQQAFKKNFAGLVKEALPATATAKPIEVWFQDEARIGQKGTLTRIWARIGSRPRAPRDTRYESAYLFGAVCPERAVGAALVMPYADSEAMNLHLQEIGRAVTPGAHAILVLDGAGWHTSHTLDPPHNVTLLCLPPYSPELNPVENVWEYLRKNNLALRIHDTYDAIVDACCKAWTDLLATPQRIASITSRRWAELS